MSDQFEKMTKDFKEYSELKVFADSQHKTIVQLSKRIQKLEDEKKHLENLLANHTPILQPAVQTSGLKIDLSVEITDQEIICRHQLGILKNTSFERELTLEECKKVIEYSKNLQMLKGKETKEKSPEEELKDKPIAELLHLVRTDAPANSKE